jgi:phospholipid/cholesterol/gamma-HCH transport system substrate-binding protein
MTERQMQLRIGILVLAALVLFAGFVLSIGSRSQLFEERYSLWTAFTTAEGLAAGSPVRLGGIPVGSVTRIDFGRDPKDRRIAVTLSVEERVRDKIRADSVATIGTIGLVGDKVLDITVGSHDKPALPSGGQLASVDPPDFMKLVQKGDQILDQVTRIGTSLEGFLGGGDGQAGRTVEETLRSLRTTVVEVEKGSGLLHELVYGKSGPALLAKLDRTAGTLEQLAQAVEKEDGLLHALIYSPQDETLGRLSRSLGEIEGLLRQARQGPGLAHALFFDPKGAELLRSLASAGEEVERFVRDFRQGEGLVPTLLFNPDSAKILGDLQATAAGMRQLTSELQGIATGVREMTADLQVVAERLRRGEGTMGALLEDPTVYEDLSALLRGANRSLLLRSLIRSLREDGQEEKP